VAESHVLRACLDYLQLRANQGHLFFLRLNSGKMFPSYTNKAGQTKQYRVQLCPEGTADIVVILGWTQECAAYPYGRETERHCEVWFIETKGKGKQSPEQADFQRKVEAQGCRYLLVRDVQELMEEMG